ncbi:Hypothetical predicted protein [Marmota monax]|uniref:Uncharacterized protein n=1 Tax=Marmota monax TaxID=9995 RepID=A0A5E4B1Q6_MARMO|nr:hypothetical protein GHT09_017847 [Marmota monax]VTJ63315.1 Hypothetical predicted protein [Marmota monax]
MECAHVLAAQFTAPTETEARGAISRLLGRAGEQFYLYIGSATNYPWLRAWAHSSGHFELSGLPQHFVLLDIAAADKAPPRHLITASFDFGAAVIKP